MRGNQPARVDEKGRLKIPAGHKRGMDEAKYGRKFFITSRDGHRAEIYAMEIWERIENDLAKLPPSEQKRRFEDAVNYFGQEVEMDAQDRLLIPQKLRDQAQLLGEVAVIGFRERLEVVNDASFVSNMQANPWVPADVAAIPVEGI